MKKFRRLFAIVAAIAMMCTMVTGLAANTLNIESIVVVDDNGNAVENGTYVVADVLAETATVTLSPAQRLKVVVSMNDGAASANDISAQVTFLSYKAATGDAAQVYDNTTIQYVNQDATDAATEKKAEFIFRPRSTNDFGPGTYQVKIGGDGIVAPSSFTYTVVAPATQVSLTAVQDAVTEFEVGKASSAVAFQMSGSSYPTTLTEVKLGSTTLTSETGYTYDSTLGQLTITAEGLNTLTEVQAYTLTVTTDENFAITALADAINVKAETQEPDPEEPTVDTDVIEGAVEDVEATVSNDGLTATFDTTVNISGTDVALTYEPAGAELPTGVSESAEGTFSLDTSVAFAAKVTVAVKAGSTEVGQKTIYLVPDSTKENIAFGNLGLVAAADGTDAFAYDSSLSADEAQTAFNTVLDGISTADKLADRAVALSIATGNAASDMLPHFKAALDFDKDGVLALSEYRIYKLMMDGDDPVHTFKAVNNARAEWAN